jgi:hypothetical protein
MSRCGADETAIMRVASTTIQALGRTPGNPSG